MKKLILFVVALPLVFASCEKEEAKYDDVKTQQYTYAAEVCDVVVTWYAKNTLVNADKHPALVAQQSISKAEPFVIEESFRAIYTTTRLSPIPDPKPIDRIVTADSVRILFKPTTGAQRELWFRKGDGQKRNICEATTYEHSLSSKRDDKRKVNYAITDYKYVIDQDLFAKATEVAAQ